MSKSELDDMNDIAALWQQQSVGDTTSIVSADKRKRRRRFLQDWAAALAMLIFGVFFLSISQLAVFIVAAIALFFGAALQLRQAYFNRSKMLHYEDWSTLGLLEYRLMASETEIRRFRYNQYGAGVIIVFTLLLPMLKYVFDMIVPTELIIAYCVITPFMLGLIWFYQFRIRQSRKVRVNLQQLIKEFLQANDV